jgi:DNA polymerase-3 subunit alpha
MGKKKKEEMDLQKARFVSGAAERGVPETQADDIFELVAKFAGYGFNKSHAAAYAVISYQTAWLKANAPVEFFAASMSLDISNTDKLAVFYQDAGRQGVKVLPPDINRSGADFEVEDGQVLYALGAVRNVGLQAMTHVAQVRESGGRFRDIFDFLERIDPRQVNKRALESLARAGAFDSIHPDRAQLVQAADALMAFAQSVAADRASAQESLFGDAAEASRPRLPKAERWDGVRQLDEELAAVGFYLSGHPLGDMAEVLRRNRVTFFVDAQAQAAAGAEAFRMVGVVRRRQERTSSTGGGKFAFVTLSDPSGEYEVLFQADALRRCRDLLEPGHSILLTVRCKAGDGEVRFFGEGAEPLNRALEKTASGLRIHISPAIAEIAALKARLRPAPAGSGGPVVFVAAFAGGREVEMRLPGRFLLDAAARGALKTAPGVAFLEDL